MSERVWQMSMLVPTRNALISRVLFNVEFARDFGYNSLIVKKDFGMTGGLRT